MYQITRDGFAFLAMGFTGHEAAQWKSTSSGLPQWQPAQLSSHLS